MSDEQSTENEQDDEQPVDPDETPAAKARVAEREAREELAAYAAEQNVTLAIHQDEGTDKVKVTVFSIYSKALSSGEDLPDDLAARLSSRYGNMIPESHFGGMFKNNEINEHRNLIEDFIDASAEVADLVMTEGPEAGDKRAKELVYEISGD